MATWPTLSTWPTWPTWSMWPTWLAWLVCTVAQFEIDERTNMGPDGMRAFRRPQSFTCFDAIHSELGRVKLLTMRHLDINEVYRRLSSFSFIF